MTHSLESHTDALSELMNIGSGRAAASLSELAQQRILLDVPTVTLTSADELGHPLTARIPGDILCVRVPFSGALSGMGVLALDTISARRLVALLDQPTDAAELGERERDVVIETGSVLLNACIGTFANLIAAPVSFGVPQFSVLQQPHAFICNANGQETAVEAFLAETRFRLGDATVGGLLAIVAPPSAVLALVHGLAHRN